MSKNICHVSRVFIVPWMLARYAFEAVEGDTVSTITPSEHDGGYSLNYEARSTAGNKSNKQIQLTSKPMYKEQPQLRGPLLVTFNILLSLVRPNFDQAS